MSNTDLALNFVTTSLAALFAIYLKEAFGFSFGNKRKKRELKFSIIKNVIKFYALSKKHAAMHNNWRLHEKRKNALIELRDSGSRVDDRDAMNKGINDIFNFMLGLEKSANELYVALAELEGTITSEALESREYFSREQGKQLKRTILKMFSPEEIGKFELKAYDNFNHDQIEVYRKKEYVSQLGIILKDIDNQQSLQTDHIDEVLRINSWSFGKWSFNKRIS